MNKISSLCATLINAETDELIEIVSNYRKDPGVFYRRYFEVALAVLSGRTCSAVGATRASEMFAVKVVDCLTREYDDEQDFVVVVLLGLTDLETELYSKSELREKPK